MKILIVDNDKIFSEGLKHVLIEYFGSKSIRVKFEETVNINTNYSMAFISSDKLAQYRCADTMINSDVVFIIQSSMVPTRDVHNARVQYIQRNQSANTILSQIDMMYAQPVLQYGIESIRPLTKRETAVLSYYSRGLTNVQIGQILGINQKTVSTHKTKAMTKLNLKHKGDFRCWLVAHPREKA
ncbi:helix-turn-helix domain-containing protein [Serratia aquatilis]|uniref:Helix-turn-helix transcriptional regulator n=1 Tax=Serratia aquatilis TaxID=1737515 RepID=A0ABV6EGD6_9GAMM